MCYDASKIACPRLSVDWGAAFAEPLLSAYELFVALEQTEWREVYPMDFYKKGGGPWTNYYEDPVEAAAKAAAKAESKAARAGGGERKTAGTGRGGKGRPPRVGGAGGAKAVKSSAAAAAAAAAAAVTLPSDGKPVEVAW